MTPPPLGSLDHGRARAASFPGESCTGLMQVIPARVGFDSLEARCSTALQTTPQTRPRLQTSEYRTLDQFEIAPKSMPQVFDFVYDCPDVPTDGRSSRSVELTEALPQVPQDRPCDIPVNPSVNPQQEAAEMGSARCGLPPRARLPTADYRTFDAFEDSPTPTAAARVLPLVSLRDRLHTAEYKTYDPFEDGAASVALRGPEQSATAAAVDMSAVQQLLRGSIKRAMQPAASEVVLPAAQQQPDRAGAEPERASNPGSVGHPEMCAKVCIYFAQGVCKNGSQCGFCHCSHLNVRKSNLDRASREYLRSLHYQEAFQFMMPVAAKRLSQLGVDLCGCRLVPARGSTPDASRLASRKLVVGLEKMGIRPLLTQMSRLAPEGTAEEDSAKNLLHALNEHCRNLAHQQ